jgi:hypothetical protein
MASENALTATILGHRISMASVVIVAAAVVSVVLMLSDRPERRPGNLAPIQLISALGAWALVLVNAAALGVAIRDEIPSLLLSPLLTILSMLLLFGVNRVRKSSVQTPGLLSDVVGEATRLTGGAPRLGMRVVDALVVTGRAPAIGVTVLAGGRVSIRIQAAVARWLEGLYEANDAGRAAATALIRFTVLHELAHVLNGDHRTYRFVRSVLVSHLWWLLTPALLVVAPEQATRALTVASLIAAMFVLQRAFARRFIAERESLADWRAIQTLAPADAACLLSRRRARWGRPQPTELEKLLVGLRAEAQSGKGSRLWSVILLWIWPEGDSIRKRIELLSRDRVGTPPRPVLWAAMTGAQVGLLATSAIVALVVSVPALRWTLEGALSALLAVFSWLAGPVGAYCAVRADPARMSIRTMPQKRKLMTVAVVFHLSLIATTIAVFLFRAAFGVEWFLTPLLLGVTLAMTAGLGVISIWFGGAGGWHHGAGDLRVTPRRLWTQEVPLLVALTVVLLPLSVGAASGVGLGPWRSGMWIPLAMTTFSAYIFSTMLARTSNPVLRAISPMALLDTPEPVYGFRIFWCDLYVDLARAGFARAVAVPLAAHVVALVVFAVPVTCAMRVTMNVVSPRVGYVAFIAIGIALIGAVLVIPTRYDAYRGAMRLGDTNWLRMFERLLASARAAGVPAAEQLAGAIAMWLRDDRLPHLLLPDRHTLWMLDPLSIVVRLARTSDGGARIEAWRAPITAAIRDLLVDDAIAIAPREKPSLYYSTLAAALAQEAGITGELPFTRMLDRIEELLEERIANGSDNIIADIVGACTLLAVNGRPLPAAERIRRLTGDTTLTRKPALRQSLAELCHLAELSGDAELRTRLMTVVRSRMWEILQLNPRKDVLLLLDCYLAAAALGATDGPVAAAPEIIEEVTTRTATELATIDH